MVSSNLASVRSGRVGLGTYEPGPVFRVWAHNSILRVARGFSTSDSDSAQKLGSYRVSPGHLRYFCTELGDADIFAPYSAVRAVRVMTRPKWVGACITRHDDQIQPGKSL